MLPSLTFLVSAGLVTESDDKLMLIQGLSNDQAEAVAECLAVATGAPAFLRHMVPLCSAFEIRKRPEDVVWKGWKKKGGLAGFNHWAGCLILRRWHSTIPGAT